MVRADLEALLSRAREHKRSIEAGFRKTPLAGRVVANLFFEDSTRTRSSFEIAAKMLGAEVLNWSTRGSSVSKGETLLDTVRNIEAMGPLAIVIRHTSSGAPALCARHVRCAVVNAGDGMHEHPSQALLDALTLMEKLGGLDGRKVAIVGDVLHSRVARSNLHCLIKLGAQVVLCGPPTLMPSGIEALGARVTYDLTAALEGADAVMLLRIQLERQGESMFPSAREYARSYGLDAARAARLEEGAVVMHPGPINRGVELAPDVADGPKSVILYQVTNGVAVRMAILEACA
ncbi:MAG: aspartate carbamoyltransferase catalytic subunit [Myxococcales bacterium]|nr:aspartate carbamoyltransferase catalytic subunit [Myxococcales bacterium]